MSRVREERRGPWQFGLCNDANDILNQFEKSILRIDCAEVAQRRIPASERALAHGNRILCQRLSQNNREGSIFLAVAEAAGRCKSSGVTIARCES